MNNIYNLRTLVSIRISIPLTLYVKTRSRKNFQEINKFGFSLFPSQEHMASSYPQFAVK